MYQVDLCYTDTPLSGDYLQWGDRCYTRLYISTYIHNLIEKHTL